MKQIIIGLICLGLSQISSATPTPCQKFKHTVNHSESLLNDNRIDDTICIIALFPILSDLRKYNLKQCLHESTELVEKIKRIIDKCK